MHSIADLIPEPASNVVPASTGLDTIATALADSGYCIIENIFPEALLHSLLQHFRSLDEAAFSSAGIGKDQDYQLNRAIRSDRICWLEEKSEAGNSITRPYFEWAEQLRLGLNRRLFLGLFDYECHYAYYPEGACYRRHLDAFRGDNSRRVSSIVYLNPHWQPGDGGELLLYSPDNNRLLETITPTFGKLVLFLSEDFPHEVLPVTRPRYSLTGWFRINQSDSSSLNPPR